MTRPGFVGLLASFVALSAQGVAAQTPAAYLEQTGILGSWSPSCGEPATWQNIRFTFAVENDLLVLRTAPPVATARPLLVITQATPESAELFTLTIRLTRLRPDGQRAPDDHGRNIQNQTWRRLPGRRLQLWRAVIQPGGDIPLSQPRVTVEAGVNQDDHSPAVTLDKCS